MLRKSRSQMCCGFLFYFLWGQWFSCFMHISV